MNNEILAIVCFLMIIIICIYISSNTHSQQISNDLDYLHNPKYKKYTILECLRYVAKTNPGKVALRVKDKKNDWKDVTFKEYYTNVEKFACAIQYYMGSNVNTAIIGFNSPGWFYAHLGTMMNGGASVGMYTTNTNETCEHILQNSNIRLLVVEDSTQLEKFIKCNMAGIEMVVYYSPIDPKLIKQFSIPVVSMGDFMLKIKRIESLPTLDDIGTIIYTSGTTGLPKGVMITHDNIMVNLKSMLQIIKTKSQLNFTSREQFISYLPLNHIAAQMMDIYIPIVLMGTVWFADKNAMKSTLGKTLQEVNPTVFIGVPRVWEKIVEQIQEKIKTEGIKGSVVKMMAPSYIVKELGLEKCKFAVTLAAPISETSRDYLQTIGIKLYDIYGMSETTGPISLSLPSLEKKGSVGLPIMRIKINKKDGEILVKGRNLFVGYLNNKKAYTNSMKDDGWFRTGDIGHLDGDGFLYVTGRLKELIITAGGENISPIPIEQTIKENIGKYFKNIIVVGDKRKFLSLLLNDAVDNKVDDINKIIQNAIDEYNKTSSSNASSIKKWIIIKNKFVVGNELTPTLKLRRDYINKKYMREIDKLYK